MDVTLKPPVEITVYEQCQAQTRPDHKLYFGPLSHPRCERPVTHMVEWGPLQVRVCEEHARFCVNNRSEVLFDFSGPIEQTNINVDWKKDRD
jgi:hypothetical protein